MRRMSSTNVHSRQSNKTKERIKCAFALLIAGILLAGMPLSAFMVSAEEGGAPAAVEIPASEPEVQQEAPAPEPAPESVPAEPAADPEQVTAEESAAEPETVLPAESEAVPESEPESVSKPESIPYSEAAPVPDGDPAAVIESAAESAPVTDPAAPEQVGASYTVNWLDDDGEKVLGTATYDSEVQPEKAIFPEGTPSEKEDDHYYYTFNPE